MKQKFELFSINERIMLIMKEKKLNKNSLSKVLGLSQPALKKIENKINLPSFKLLFEILTEFPDISTEWLMKGTGQMLNVQKKIKDDNPDYQSGDTKSIICESSVSYQDYKQAAKAEINSLKEEIKMKDKQVSDLIKMNLYLLEREKEGGHTLPESAKEDRLTG